MRLHRRETGPTSTVRLVLLGGLASAVGIGMLSAASPLYGLGALLALVGFALSLGRRLISLYLLGAIMAFILLGLAVENGTAPMLSALVSPLWFLGYVVCSAINRGGFLAATVAAGLAFLIRPTSRIVPGFIVAGVLVTSLALLNPQVSFGFHRELSVQQFTANILSIAGGKNNGDLQDTKDWRLKWWTKIFDYTVRGRYFWTGKGFGINLADADGFQVTDDDSLRAPHNGHMTVLARTGVPGMALWLAFQGTFGVMLLSASRRARRLGQRFWWQVDAWLLAYWAAIMVNASFDVYLESPQGGILLYMVMGLGMAAMRLQRTEEREAASRDDAGIRSGSPSLVRIWRERDAGGGEDLVARAVS